MSVALPLTATAPTVTSVVVTSANTSTSTTASTAKTAALPALHLPPLLAANPFFQPLLAEVLRGGFVNANRLSAKELNRTIDESLAASGYQLTALDAIRRKLETPQIAAATTAPLIASTPAADAKSAPAAATAGASFLDFLDDSSDGATTAAGTELPPAVRADRVSQLRAVPLPAELHAAAAGDLSAFLALKSEYAKLRVLFAVNEPAPAATAAWRTYDASPASGAAAAAGGVLVIPSDIASSAERSAVLLWRSVLAAHSRAQPSDCDLVFQFLSLLIGWLCGPHARPKSSDDRWSTRVAEREREQKAAAAAAAVAAVGDAKSESAATDSKSNAAATTATAPAAVALDSNFAASCNVASLKQLLLSAECLHVLCLLQLSFSDRLRFFAANLLLVLREINVPAYDTVWPPDSLSSVAARERQWVSVSARVVSLRCQAIFHYCTNIEHWCYALGDHTFKTYFVDLTRTEATHIIAAFQSHYLGTGASTASGGSSSGGSAGGKSASRNNELRGLESRIDSELVARFPNRRAFFKLSSRSAKDAVFQLPQYQTMLDALIARWTDEYKLTSPIPESIKHAAEQTCAAKCMLVQSGGEIIDMLTTSHRISVDLTEALKYAESFSVKLVLRAWHDFPPHFELRGIVRGRQLNALSQYFATEYFPFVTLSDWRAIKLRIAAYFAGVREVLPLADCVVDFVVLPDRIMIIEVNSFGELAGAALFNWERDEHVMYYGPSDGSGFEFRVIADSQLTVAVL